MADVSETGVFGFVIRHMGVVELVLIYGLLMAFAYRELRKTNKTLEKTEADKAEARKDRASDALGVQPTPPTTAE
ncbi:MAG: hypothetical protein AAFW83_12030 [Pseudomonadota bacterium]